jgi:hypothetical protein
MMPAPPTFTELDAQVRGKQSSRPALTVAYCVTNFSGTLRTLPAELGNLVNLEELCR